MKYAKQDNRHSVKDKQKDGKKAFKPPKKISQRYLYNSGLAYLQRYPASSMHFRFIMMRKINKSCRHHEDQKIEDCQALLENLIQQFRDSGLLDDTAYLKGMITSLRRRGLSASQIQNKLRQKGYDTDDIHQEIQTYDNEALHESLDSDNEFYGDKKAALIYARKKRIGPFDTENKKDPQKSLASMARAGYSVAVVPIFFCDTSSNSPP